MSVIAVPSRITQLAWRYRLVRVAFATGLFLAAWEVLYLAWNPRDELFPSVDAVVRASITHADSLASHAWITLYETLIGFACALAAGILGALALDAAPRLARFMWPSILVAQVTPKIAIAPLLLVWLGFGALPKVIIAFLIAFFPILLNAYAGFQSLEYEIEELARSMRSGRWRLLVRFKIPNALPRLFAGARIGATFAVIGTIVAEFVGSDNGLGYLILLANRLLDPALMMAAVIVLGVMGLLLYSAVGAVERLAIPWHHAQRRSLRQAAESLGL